MPTQNIVYTQDELNTGDLWWKIEKKKLKPYPSGDTLVSIIAFETFHSPSSAEFPDINTHSPTPGSAWTWKTISRKTLSFVSILGV